MVDCVWCVNAITGGQEHPADVTAAFALASFVSTSSTKSSVNAPKKFSGERTPGFCCVSTPTSNTAGHFWRAFVPSTFYGKSSWDTTSNYRPEPLPLVGKTNRTCTLWKLRRNLAPGPRAANGPCSSSSCAPIAPYRG